MRRRPPSSRRRGGLLPLLALTAGAAWLAPHVARRRRAVQAVAPELRSPGLFVPTDLTPRRVRLANALPVRPAELGPDVRLREERTADGVPLRVVERTDRTGTTGALVWIHGGGYVLGSAVADDETAARLARDLGVLVVNVEYRLAGVAPAPAGVEDCFSALRWVHERAATLGVDPARVAVGGASAGGGLAACLAQLAHDRGVDVALQALVYPMLDDRTVLRTDHGGTGTFVWTPASNRLGWTTYLGHAPGSAEPVPYAVAARRGDLAGLAPAWIGVGDLDLFHAEDVAYAERLRAAGVACELVEIPGAYHGSDGFFPAAPQTVQLRESLNEALRRVLVPGR
ncbi:alpha/beta hydrolase [Kineococcus gynurae]|uniref:Alpha/beta hydrolase n=1 Tax=Kineococcus gynurae TaxID=452979 RepID=A0ABV5LSZ6_9ACTN